VALLGEQGALALVSWAWKSSIPASRASKIAGEGLNGEKAPAQPLRIVRGDWAAKGEPKYSVWLHSR